MTRARQALFTLLICLVYVIPFPYLQGINNPNENTRTYLVMALVDDHSWSLDRVVARYGWTNDMASVPDATAANGSHLAAVKGPATAYLGVPVYVAQRAVMSLLGKGPPSPTSPATERAAWLRTTTLTLELFCSHLPCLAFLLWMERRLRAWSKDDVLRLSAVLSVAIGSNFLAYSFVFVSHALIGATAFVAVDWLLRCRAHPTHERVSWHAWMAGLAAGFITLLEYPALFVSACLGVYALWVLRGWKPRLMFALGAALNAALLMLFQWGSFGNPLTPGHRMMQTQEFKALSEKGFFTLGLPDPHAAFALLFDSTFGLLSTSPFLMLSIVGVAAALFLRRSDGAWVQRRSIALLASICVALIVMAVSASVIWRGGWTIGPRYLGLAPPLLATVALFGLESWATSSTRRWIARGVAGALLVASFVKIGAIAFVVVTLPEAIEKPVAQMFVPLVKTGFRSASRSR
ncbi:MAG: hypothetical protein U0165_09385 [Polyangiaceae bacterium]